MIEQEVEVDDCFDRIRENRELTSREVVGKKAKLVDFDDFLVVVFDFYLVMGVSTGRPKRLAPPPPPPPLDAGQPPPLHPLNDNRKVCTDSLLFGALYANQADKILLVVRGRGCAARH